MDPVNSKSTPKIVTIGAYGFDEQRFLEALTHAHVDTFCDLRLRRGMRGRQYAFANSARLQESLSRLNIRYIHIKELAPSQSIRSLQKEADAMSGQTKSSRTGLAPEFVQSYRQQNLSRFKVSDFLSLVRDASVVALFCVERDPRACHRSIVADQFSQELNTPIHNLTP